MPEEEKKDIGPYKPGLKFKVRAPPPPSELHLTDGEVSLIIQVKEPLLRNFEKMMTEIGHIQEARDIMIKYGLKITTHIK